MDLVHLVLTLAALEELDLASLAEAPERTVLSCSDATTVVALAAQADRLVGPIGVWLAVDGDYRAQLAARDVATLSWLVELDTVVIGAPSAARQHARIVEALLSDDEVTIVNDVATVRGAYNRPSPPRDVQVWSSDGAELHRGARSLVAHSTVPRWGGVATTYGPALSGL